MSDAAHDIDPHAELRDQLAATRAAAESIAREAAAARAEHDRGAIPPMGWATPEDRSEKADELRSLIALVEALRALVPADLEAQVRELLRQLLLLVRAVVDWVVAKMDAALADGGPVGPARSERRGPQDVPIA